MMRVAPRVTRDPYNAVPTVLTFKGWSSSFEVDFLEHVSCRNYMSFIHILQY